MATLTGKIMDVTSRPPDSISSITVKAPAARIGSGSDVIVSSPATVDFNSSTGDITINGLTGGLSWLYIEGDGWSDSIAFAVAEGMNTLVEAIANASGVPGLVDYLAIIKNIEQYSQDFVDGIQADTYGGYQPASVSVDTLLAGGSNSYSRAYYGVAAGSTTPDGGGGVLDVTNAGRKFTQVFYGMDNNNVYTRVITDRSHIVPGQWFFGEWKRLDNQQKFITLTAGANVDDLRGDIVATIPATSMGITGLPVDVGGTLIVTDVKNASGNIYTQTLITAMQTGAAEPGVYWRTSWSSDGRWGPWAKVAQDSPDRMQLAPARREAVVEAGLTRRGRVIGTGGLPAIALRFDHHLVPFGTKVLPVLKRLRLPWGQMLMPSTVGSGNDNWTWSRIAQECHDSGGEVWNHSFSHSDILNTGQADREVSLSLTRLKENLPSLWIDAWAPPGQPAMMGYEGQDTPEKHWKTYPGRLILAQHALVRGYYPAVYRKLNGPELVGTGHVTIDKMDSNTVGGMVRGAMSTTSGLTLMLHSTYLDQSGYMTTAQLTSALEYIAQLRDQGEIVVLSPAGVMLADQEKPRSTGNITTAGTAGSITGSWTETLWAREADQHYGVPHEAEVWVKGSGAVSLTVEVTSATRPVTQTHTVALAAGTSQRLSVVVTPPMDTTATKITITGSVTHTGIRYRPI